MTHKIASLIVFLFISVSHCFGQVREFEFLAGPNMTSLRRNDFLRHYSRSKISYFVGIGTRIGIKERSAVNFKLILDRKGSSVTYYQVDANNVPYGIVKWKTHLDYLTLPVTYGYNFGSKIIEIEGGLFLGYLLRYKDTSGADKSTIKKFDFGLSAGFNFRIPVSENWQIKLGTLSHYGIVNISNVPVYNNGIIRTISRNIIFGLVYKG